MTEPQGQPQQPADPTDPREQALSAAMYGLWDAYAAADVPDGFSPDAVANTAAGGQILQILLAVAMQVFQQCLAGGGTPQGVVNAAQRRGIFARLMARRQVTAALRDQYGPGAFSQYHGDRIVEALVTYAGKAKAADLVSAYQAASNTAP